MVRETKNKGMLSFSGRNSVSEMLHTTVFMTLIDYMDAKAYASETNTPAIPMPVPTHILVTATFCFRRLSSDRTVTTCLVPVAPSGCPIALGFVGQRMQGRWVDGENKGVDGDLHGASADVDLVDIQTEGVDAVDILGEPIY